MPMWNFLLMRKKNGKFSFPDVEVSQEGNKVDTVVYCKPTFSGFYMHFDSCLPTAYKFGMVYTLALDVFQFVPNGLSFKKKKWLSNIIRR